MYLTFDRLAQRFSSGGQKVGPTTTYGPPREIMNFSELSIRKPVATTLLTIALALAGLTAY